MKTTHERPLVDYDDATGGDKFITSNVPPIIAVPTTAGTGSEVGRSAVVSEDDTHIKRIVFSPKILAKQVFADPELTVGLPAGVTAATGMDALTHNVESYLSPAYHPLCDGIALEGARIAAHALPTAVRDGSNLAARGDMLMASMMGAIAFQKDLGSVHACAHALGAVLMPVQVGKLFGIDHACATPTGEELDRDQRDRQPAGVDPDVISKHDAPRIDDVEEHLLDLLDTPVGVDDLVRLMPERTEVKTVLDCVLGMAVGPTALGLRVGPGLEDCLRRGGEGALDDKVGVRTRCVLHRVALPCCSAR